MIQTDCSSAGIVLDIKARRVLLRRLRLFQMVIILPSFLQLS